MAVEDISADHMYWLDMAEEHYKDDGLMGRTIPVKAGAEFPEIEDEYEDLQSMYELEPENVAEPLMPVYDDSGDMNGFYIEDVDGEPLGRYLEQEEVGEEVIDEVERTLETFHQNGLVHADLAGNVLYNPQEGIKIIDPVGAGKDHEKFADLRDLDRKDLESYRERLA
jgi:tRNA A-37 threonylcarbamoyl transferase component Bud32